MKLSKIILGVMLFMSVSGTAQYKLQYKSSGATPIHYKAHTTVETVQTMMGQEAKVNVVSDQAITVSSTNVDSELIYSTTIDSGENVVVMPSGDTNRTKSPAIGETRETRIRPNGEELSSRWLDTTFANTQTGQMKDLGSFFFKLPTSAIDTGAMWHQDKTDTVNTPGAQGKIVVNTNTDYKLVGKDIVDGVSCARIEYSGKVTLKGAASVNGMNLAIDGNGTITGSAYFDYTAGRVVKIHGASNQDLVMASAGDNPMTIPMSQQTAYDLTLAK